MASVYKVRGIKQAMGNREDAAQLLAAAQQRDETLSGMLQKYPADWDEILKKLDAVLGAYPDLLKPVGLLELRSAMEEKRTTARQAVAPTDGKVDWAYLTQLVESPTALAGKTEEGAKGHSVAEKTSALLPGLKEGTRGHQICNAIEKGYRTTKQLMQHLGLNNSILSYNLTQLYQAGFIERTGRGEYRIKSAAPEDTNEKGKGSDTKKENIKKAPLKWGALAAEMRSYLETHPETPYAALVSNFEQKGYKIDSIRSGITRFAKQNVIRVEGKKGERMIKYATGSADPAAKDPAAPRPPFTEQGRTAGAAENPEITTDELNVYYGTLPQLDVALSMYQTAVDRLPDEIKGRFVKIGCRILPVKKEDAAAGHADAISAVAEALEKSIAKGGDAEPLAKQLESMGDGSINDADVTAYFANLPGKPSPQKGMPADKAIRGVQNPRDDEFWTPLLAKPGYVGVTLREHKPYLDKRCPSAAAALKLCCKDPNGKEGWIAYATKEIAQHAKRLEEKYSSVPEEFGRGLDTLAKLPDHDRYLHTVVDALKAGGPLWDVAKSREFFSQITGRGKNLITSIFRQYKLSP